MLLSDHRPDIPEQYRPVFERPGIKKTGVIGYSDEVGSASKNMALSEKINRRVAIMLYH